MPTFAFNEKYLSQIPALMECINLGYTYIRPEQVSAERGGHLSNVLLENVLREQLKKINRIHYKGTEYLFSEENIQTAIQKIKNVKFEGLQKTNEYVYDLITLGSSFEQTIEDRSASYTLNYIDWKNPANNVFHVVAEFAVECMRGTGTARPDILLFVNGIPLVVVECKSPDIDVDEGISQNIRNQDVEYIPQLFAYAQVLLSVNKNKAKYATAGTKLEFWSIWKEQDDTDEAVHTCANKALSAEDKDALFSGDFKSTRPHFDALESEGGRVVTEQDKCLYSLCRPQRLLEIVHRFIIFDLGIKKIARYQQFFLVRSAIKQIKQKNNEGKRTGGIVWHTQGSGKSITMVMLVRTLMLDRALKGLRIILVTDRKDLDKQLGNTFQACGLDRKHATSGRDLVRHIQNKQGIITTLIHKFEKAVSSTKFVDDSPDIIVLVDESHRTQFGSLAAGMRRMLPNVCYIGFTGTPLLKADKNSFARFGGLIQPNYSVRQAIEDKAVVPLLYEGRHVEIEQSQDAVDLWFARHTEDLTDQQKADLKRKYSRAKELSQTDQVIYMRAFDISTHFQSHWQGTGFKAQLVAGSKVTALNYHNCFKQIGAVSSELVISPPDTREGYEEVGAETKNEVGRFWKEMMTRYGSEEQYNKQIINQFKEADTPEILIVVDKLITGFDAPRNTVLYLCRKLREHTLLQAIARVNRLYQGKEYGYIVDYENVLGELDKALTTYDELEGFDSTDLAGFLISINERVAQLPQQHSELWDLFKEIKNSHDEEKYEVLLADEGLRDDFYERLSRYSKTLAMALSSEKFVMQADEIQLQDYKSDFKRFQKLKGAVKLRYAEAIDYRNYEPRIKKLLNTFIQANEVIQLNTRVNIFDDNEFTMIKESRGIYRKKTPRAKADIIAHATKRKIVENMDKDPAFYKQFSELIQDTIDAFRQQRISDQVYLQEVSDIRDRAMKMQRDDLPEQIREDAEACAYFGAVKPCFAEMDIDESQANDIAAQTALAIKQSIERNWKVDFWSDIDTQNAVKNEIDDFLFDEVKAAQGVDLSPQEMDDIVSKAMKVAKFWEHS